MTDETGVDETVVDETVVDETGVDELGINLSTQSKHLKPEVTAEKHQPT